MTQQSPLVVDAHSDVVSATSRPSIGGGTQVLLALANAASWLAIIPLYQLLLPTQVALLDATNKVADLAQITFVAGITALIAQPITGALSDRTTSRWGRRRPWMLAGMLLTVVALLVLAQARNLLTVTIALAAFGFTMNMVLASVLAIIPDLVPVRQRATVSAVLGLAQPTGTLIGIMLIAQLANLAAAYYVIAVILAVAIGACCLWLPEQPVRQEDLEPFSWLRFATGFVRPLRSRDFTLAWLARFCTIAAQTILATYILFYIQDAHLLPPAQAAQGVGLFQLVLTVSLVITSLITGRVSDRLQRRKPFVLLAGGIMTAAFVLLALIPTWSMVLVAAGIFGAGFGVFVAGDLALSTQVLPDTRSAGRDLGIITAGTILPELLFPVIAWLAFSVFNGYAALFGICAAACVLGALFILPIRHVR